jgi:hypothetical protein
MDGAYLNKLIKNIQQLIKVEMTEVEFAYRRVNELSSVMGLFGKKAHFEIIRDFVYCVYPSFFLKGIKLDQKWLIITEKGKVIEDISNKLHCPSPYCFAHLSSLMQCCRAFFQWELSFEESSKIISHCQLDFSKEYLKKFPYVTRIFTQNEQKQEQYRNLGVPVEFGYFDFQEVQGTVEEIVRDKLVQVMMPAKESVTVVDDEGLNIEALADTPGPYIKDFFQKVGVSGVSEITQKYDNTNMTVEISIGMKFMEERNGDDFQRVMVMSATFPVKWMKYWLPTKSGYYGYLQYRGMPMVEVQETSYAPRNIMLFWMWHRYRRRRTYCRK